MWSYHGFPSLIMLLLLLPDSSHSAWSPENISMLHSNGCANGYQEDTGAKDFLCDPDALIGQSMVRHFVENLKPDWKFCPYKKLLRTSFRPRARLKEREAVQQQWTLAVGVTRVLSVGGNCQNSNQRLLEAAGKIRERWRTEIDCEIDLLLFLTAHVYLCSNDREAKHLSLASAMSPRFKSAWKRTGGDGLGVVRREKWVEGSILENQMFHMAQQTLDLFHFQAGKEVGKSEKKPSSNEHTIPVWALLLFAACLAVSLGCAYFGHWINNVNCVLNQRGEGSSRNPVLSGARHRRQWGAGFGGGMIEMRHLNPNAAAGGNAGQRPRTARAKMFGAMGARSKASGQGGGHRF